MMNKYLCVKTTISMLLELLNEKRFSLNSGSVFSSNPVMDITGLERIRKSLKQIYSGR